MNENQQKILKLAESEDVFQMTPTKLADKADINHAFKAQYHLRELVKKGLIYKDLESGVSRVSDGGSINLGGLLSIPVVGSANCGPARELAQENVEGYLRISEKFVYKYRNHKLIALRSVGDSLNKADIDGFNVEEGDYVIVDCEKEPQNGDYVLSVIDDAANFKRFYKQGDEIRLVSESTLELPPIILHKEDVDSIGYVINGVAVKVIKR